MRSECVGSMMRPEYYCLTLHISVRRSEQASHLIEWGTDCAEESESNESRLHTHKAKALKQAWSIANEGEEQELSHEVELNDAQIFQGVLQLPVPCKESQILSIQRILLTFALGSVQRSAQVSHPYRKDPVTGSLLLNFLSLVHIYVEAVWLVTVFESRKKWMVWCSVLKFTDISRANF